MGRPAKYLTHEERLRARRARRATRALPSDSPAEKRQQNQRYRLKKRGLKLLGEPMFPVDKGIRDLATTEMASAQYQSLFFQFLGGRHSLGFDELDIGEEDLKLLTGLPPYPRPILEMQDFHEEWLKIGAAMHGYATRIYLRSLDERTRLSTTQREYTIIVDLFKARERLEFLNEIFSRTYTQYIELGRYAEANVVRENTLWNCRELEYNREDICAVKTGYGAFLRTISERRWTLGKGGSGL